MTRPIIKNVCPLVLAATPARPQLFKACLETWLPYFENYLISGDSELTDDISHCIASDNTGWHSCPPKLFNGLKEVVKKYPDCEWVFIVDDDTFVNDIHLRALISTLDPDVRAIYGRDMTGNFPFNNEQVPFCSGGAGTLIPGAIVSEIVSKIQTPEWSWLCRCSRVGEVRCDIGEIPLDAQADVKLGYFTWKNNIEQVNLGELLRPENYDHPWHGSVGPEDILNRVTYHRQKEKDQRVSAEILNSCGVKS